MKNPQFAPQSGQALKKFSLLESHRSSVVNQKKINESEIKDPGYSF